MTDPTKINPALIEDWDYSDEELDEAALDEAALDEAALDEAALDEAALDEAALNEFDYFDGTEDELDHEVLESLRESGL